MELLHRHRIFSTTKLDEGEEFASQIWERNQSIVTEGSYGIHWNQVDIDKTSLSYVEHDCAVDLKAQGPLSDHFRVFFHAGGAIGHSVHGRSFVSDEANTVAHSPGMDLSLDIKPFELLLLSIDGEFVRRAMVQRFDKLPPFAHWLGELRQSSNLHTLRSLAGWLAAEMEHGNSPLSQAGRSRIHAERLLLSLFVECLAEAAPSGSDRVEDVSLLQVRKAEEWIEANLTEVIGVEELAAAIGVGVRSLQKSFKRIHGCSPQEFIIRRRLESARQLLVSATTEDTVTAIATRMGFFELGRFSQRYRRHFGETPSATLGRGRDGRNLR